MNVKMNCYCENEKLKLTGSQVNLTSRSDQTALGSFCCRSRPYSAVHNCRNCIENKTKYMRPKSAECTSLKQSESYNWPLATGDNNLSGNSIMTVSHFTDSSSKLLQNLVECNSHEMHVFEGRCFSTEKLPKGYPTCPRGSTDEEKQLESENSMEVLIDHLKCDSKYQKLLQKENKMNAKESKNFCENMEEKTVRFCEWPPPELTYKKKSDIYCTCSRSCENIYPCLKNKFRSSQEMHICHRQEKTLGEIKEFDIPRIGDPITQSENDLISILNSQTEPANLKSGEKNFGETPWDNSSQDQTKNKNEETTISQNKMLEPPKSFEAETHVEDKCSEKFSKLAQSSDEETHDENGEQEEVSEEGIKDGVNQKINVSDSMYEEIVGLLKTLEEESSESMNLENKEGPGLEIPAAETSPKGKINYFGTVSSYLEEMEINDNNFHENYVNSQKWSSKHFTSPRLEEVLNKSSVELAHEVFTLKIQIEDQKKGIKLLKDTLAEMKEEKKVVALEHQEALQKVSSEAEALVQRHQKFIKQLLSEKKNLNETVSKLVQDLKSGEERYKRNIKAMEEKHLIEIKRAKEAQAVADKIRREKWMENKTKKLKEMTVKGLEPELSRMAARQQEEVTELRNLHKAELEAVELRAARRTSELMDELRAELTKEKERAIAKEVSTLRSSMEKDFEGERNKFQQYYQSLKERIRKQEEKLSNQEFEYQQRLLEFKQEEEKKKQKVIREHDEKLEEVRKQHLVELRNLREEVEAEKEVALNNYKKAQLVKFNEREAELHQQYKKERDQEIEMVIETLEKESSKVQLELNMANEGKMKRLKDKMESEIKEMEANEAALRDKLTETKSKLAEKEDAITEINSQMRKLQTELAFFKKSCDEMSGEKAKLREIIRDEFETSLSGIAKEKENLEREIAILKELHVKELAKKDQQNVQDKHEMQKELTRVYSRIKTAVNKKEKIIESLREENEAASQRCRQLEFMLDQQRRNLLLQKRKERIPRTVGKQKVDA